MSDHSVDVGGDGPLLSVEGLEKHYPIKQGVLKREVGRVKAVDGISFDVDRGETVGLVGESGCGKSTVAEAVLRLDDPTAGDVYFDGQDITEFDDTELKAFRREAQMIFQNPDSSFDPRMTVGESIAEPLRIHGVGPRERRLSIARDLLDRVGLHPDDVNQYPHEMSGGQKQRIALARALVVNPRLIVADEPVSALDVSVQADVLSLLKDIQDEFDLSVLMISHDLSVVREVCDRVAVMYLGEIVEVAETEELFENPQHPYTRALLGSIPSLDTGKRGIDAQLSGEVPNPSDPPSGCNFYTRCPEVIQPDEYDFEQEAWRAVMDLRTSLDRHGIDVDGLRDFVGAEDGAAPTDSEVREMREELRQEHGIPATLSDPAADEVLGEAIEAIVNGNADAARESLSETFETPCEATNPGFRDTDVEHPAACLQYEETADRETSETVVSD